MICECHYAECHSSKGFLLIVIILGVFGFNVPKLYYHSNAVMLCGIMNNNAMLRLVMLRVLIIGIFI
jgi:hypothetical protein